ncbi:sensor domain-containing diguanylate cyclase [Ancylobacter radicis]|uniref:Diguanylate cyclase n=1 Tax=Ancylobacter radicis TaxID=2836179 RepID=A0ABS5R8Z0_9HYPH|nr:diguanylate cyclase [Ancylobacter radicis]MBS9476832.1 diguanylate cyclase [Ancylobacter radicis]
MMIAPRDSAQMFDLAPVSLWLEDFSAVGQLFAQWRAEGVTSLREHLRGRPDRVAECSRRIRVITVNRRTLELFEATSQEHLVANLAQVFRNDMLKTHIEELTQLWDGKLNFASQTVNYTLSGQRLDILLKGTVLPGHEESLDRVLLSIEDITERETARRQTAQAELYARGLFQHSPVSLWVEDFSSIKRLIDDVRLRGIVDLRVFTDVHPEFVERCISEVRVIDVNQHTLDMFGASSKADLIANIGSVFRDEMHRHFREQLIELWNGKLFHQREVVNYTLAGEELHVHLQFSVLPGHEHDWSLVQVALTDITARKKAEAYLEYLGKHDVLTQLYNRSFYADELNRLERKGPFPVTIIMIDLNNLKLVNDQLGHAAGDTLLRRAGEVLSKAVDRPSCAARIGGDEFAILLPGIDAAGGQAVMENIGKLIELNNQFYSATALSVSIGMATSLTGERLEQVVKRADFAMYQDKRNQEPSERTLA